MSGTNRSGRPRKSVEFKKAAGTYRQDRDGDELPVDGEPIRPRGLTKDERWLWDSVVLAYRGTGVLATIDTAALLSACELWSLYRSALAIVKLDPTDKEARIAVISYWTSFERAASRLGLNPSDRARMNVEMRTAKEPQSKDRFFKGVG
jgi:phage terminase small subunit